MHTGISNNSFKERRIMTHALIFNDDILDSDIEFLIIKKHYADFWTLPGGCTENRETPQQACARGVKEDIGANIRVGRHLSVEYNAKFGDKTSLWVIYYGGRLAGKDIKDLRLTNKQIRDYKFITIEQAMPIIDPIFRKILPISIDNLHNNFHPHLEGYLKDIEKNKFF